MLCDLWRWAGEWRGGAARPLVSAGIAIVVGATALYALAYVVGVYGQPLTSVRAGEWVRENVPRGSVILKEHWEEGLPRLGGYDIRELEMYNPDGAGKTRHIAERLAGADYLVLYSNRLYGTISRLPERYPHSAAYYELLFAGQLGYEIRLVETAYPNLLGVGLVDDTFGRAGLPEPPASREQADFPLALRLGYADESFTVYDHPKVLVLENVGRLDASQIEEMLKSVRKLLVGAPPAASVVQPGSDADDFPALMLSPEDAATQQAGRHLARDRRRRQLGQPLPCAGVAHRGRGVVAARVARSAAAVPSPARPGLLAGQGAWRCWRRAWWCGCWPACAGCPSRRRSIAVGAVVLAGVSMVALVLRGGEIRAFVRERWRLIVDMRGVVPGRLPRVRGAADGQPGPVAPVPGRRKAHGLRVPERGGAFDVHAALRPLVRRWLPELLLLGAVLGRHADKGNGNPAGGRLQPRGADILRTRGGRRVLRGLQPRRKLSAHRSHPRQRRWHPSSRAPVRQGDRGRRPLRRGRGAARRAVRVRAGQPRRRGAARWRRAALARVRRATSASTTGGARA